MKLDSTTLRRLIPVGAVAGVLALSYTAQAPSLASNNDVGYGYANNCGLKGDGMHDHGKVCPNRPFPGHGFGVLRILGITTTSTGSSGTSNEGRGSGHAKSEAVVSTAATAVGGSSSDTDDVTNSGKHHGNGHGQGRRR
jgi:hypothetical protein